MRPKRLFVATALALGIALSCPTTASAGGFENSDGTPEVSPYGRSGVQLTATQAGESVTGPGAPSWLSKCSWNDMTKREVDARYREHTGIKARTDSEYADIGIDPDEDWVFVVCRQDADVLAAAPIVGLDWLIARTRASVDIPVQIGDSAPAGTTDVPWITQLDTWLWIDDTVWQPRSATSPSLFGTTVTVTATPVQVEFEDDDGHSVDCGDNTGTPFDPDRPDQTTDCYLTPEHSSRTGDRTLTSRITWDVAYTCNQYCGSGPLPSFVVENTRPVVTNEYLVVES